MSIGNARQEAKPQIIETSSSVLIDSQAQSKKDSLNILHVDDDVSLLEVSKQILTDENNFEIDNVTSVDEAFKKLEQQTYDAIISDYEMPLKNGLDFLKELRSQQKEISFILFTGRGREDVAIKALNLGADRYINKNGSPETVYGELADAISKTVERKKSKQLLVESEIKYRTLVEKSLQGVLITKTSPLQLVFANSAMGKILGYSTDELKSLSPLGVANLIHDEDKAVFFSRLESRMHGKPSDSSLELKAMRKDGSIIWLEAFATRIEYLGEPAVQGVFLDITERKKAEDALRKSEQRWSTTLASIGDAVIATDLSGKVTFMNAEAEKLTGWTLNDASNKHIKEVFHIVNEKSRLEVEDPVTKVLETGSTIGLANNAVLISKDGTEVAIDDSGAPIKNIDGEITGVVLVFHDITEIRKMQNSLTKSEAQYRLLAENSQDVIWTMNLEGTFTYMSPSVYQLRGYTAQEVLKQNIRDVLTPDSLKTAFENLGAFYLTGVTPPPLELEQTCKDGSTVWIEVNFSVIRDKNGNPESILGVSRNINERKKMEKSLEEERQDLNRIIDSSPIIIFYKDKEGKFIRVNEAFAEALKIPKEKFIGKTVFDFYSAEIAQGMANDDFNVLKSGRSRLDIIEQYESASGIRWVQTDKIPILDKNGISNGLIGFAQDITERKKAEEELEQALIQLSLVNEKLGVVGSLTRHDVNNKLSAVSGYAYLLKKKHMDQPDVVDGLCKIEQAVLDSAKIFEFSKLYEKLGVEKLTYMDLCAVVDEAVALFTGLKFKVVNECQGRSVLADLFLRQMFYNFIDNTRKYGEKATTARVYFEEEESGGLRLIYEDDGVGISTENKKKLFAEGFSTGGSSGFGLFFIKKMMDVYRWTITEEGEPGKGAKFVIRLPPPQELNGKLVFK
jgi:PAS domain S-box-containing protein